MLKKEADKLKKLKLLANTEQVSEEPKLNWFDLLAIFAFCWVVSQFL